MNARRTGSGLVILVLVMVLVMVLATRAAVAESPCREAPVWEAWLRAQVTTWTRRLAPLPGHEPFALPVVCRATGGAPRTDGGRIWIPPLGEEAFKVALAHEYVHLAFRHHPLARDERWVEQVARALVAGEELP